MSRQAIANIVAIALIAVVVLRSMGGGGVLPIPKSSPIEADGFRVLMVYESGDLQEYPSSQLAVLNSTEIRGYLMSKCEKQNGSPDYRILDQDANMENDFPHWQVAMKRERSSLPWIVIGGDNDGFEGPLPDSIPAAMTLLRRYGG